MPIQPINSGSNPISQAIGAADVNKTQFLQMLVSQLKAQDPFEPVKNEQFLAQLATFSQLEEQQSSSGLLRNILAAQEAQLVLGGLSQGAALVGKTVEYIDTTTGNQVRGTVQSVFFTENGVMVEVDGNIVPAGNIVIISTPIPSTGTGGSTGSGGGNNNSSNGGAGSTATPTNPSLSVNDAVAN
ncbi:MAG: hypothetical protein EXS14_10420 [Planctomycetes bacterium]|nr:hypothetical protein [Planctomycetota bacterium]